MEIKEIAIEKLIPADYNPREKTEHVLSAVRQSIKEYGFLQPVVVNTHECERCGDRRNIIIGGHRRIEAAQAEGLESVPAVFVNLHKDDEKRANLRLNSQEAFKKDQLAALITELHSLDAESAGKLGFSAQDIVRLSQGRPRAYQERIQKPAADPKGYY